MKEEFRTVLCEGSDELVEKRSRFIATVKPVRTEAEAIEFLENLKKKYWDARHNVYAYILEDNNIQRYSDDGEPAGTAGVPVLDMIKKEGLSNLIVVVTRYFGGILLGTGGLVHAYSKSAKMGVEAARPVTMTLCREVLIECDYSLLGKVQNEVLGQGFKVSDTTYADNVCVSVLVPVSKTEKFVKDLTDKTNGKISIKEGETGYNQM
ncbi:MAG: YigZ family protein [Clostridia bacterium]|nr:YigZ family protein [Clostridia bacterium]